jgi:hypothetical protein
MTQDVKRPFNEPSLTEEASLADVTLQSGTSTGPVGGAS